MSKLKPCLAVGLLAAALAAGGLSGTAAGSSKGDDQPPWCLTGPSGPRTIDYPDLPNLFGPGQGMTLGQVFLALDNGGQVWSVYTTSGYAGASTSPNLPPHEKWVLPDGSTVTQVTAYTITDGACGSGGGNTTTTTETTTSAATTTVPTTTAPPPLAAGQAYICESNTQTEPSVETRRFAYRLWDKGNFVPYAAHGSYGGLQVGGYSLICNPYHFRLKLTQGKWVNDDGDQVSYLDLGQYPVVVP